MAAQVYNVGNQENDLLVKQCSPVEYTADELLAEEWDTEGEAMSSATYLTVTTGVSHVVVGPHPKPHR